MIFASKLPLPPVPSCDAFNYIFHHGRRNYSTDRVLYRVDGTDETLTFEVLEQKSRQFADAIREYYDIMPNDVVAILAKDKIQYPIAYYGILAAGAVVALIPVQKEMSETDVAARLEQAKAKLVITDSELLRLTEVASMLAGCISVMTLDANDQNWPCVDSLLPMGNPDAQTFELKTPQEVDQHNAFINRTSGSTGTMKSVLTSHAHYIATMEATVGTIPADTNPDRDVWVSPLSLGFFINAKLHMGLNILLGIPVVLMKHTLDETTVDVVARHHITFLFITPPIAARLARADLRHIDVSSVKWLLTAGAPMHENLRRTVSRQFGGVHLTLEWATSETMLLAMQVDECSKQPGSSGTLVNGIQAKVINVETGRECSYGEEGEILVRNAIARFKGYKDNEVANRDFDSEGWFHTGDYGYLDQNCNVYIVDRIKELLKVGEGYGSHVSAAEIEAILFEHPAVSSVVVVGVRNTETQVDEPTAFVILKTEYRSRTAQITRDIERYARAKLTGLRRLTGGVHCISSYPTTGFKINRRALKSMVPSKMPKMPVVPSCLLPTMSAISAMRMCWGLYGTEDLERILVRCVADLPFSEDVVEAAASTYSGDRITYPAPWTEPTNHCKRGQSSISILWVTMVELLIRYRGESQPITEDVVKAAAMNYESYHEDSGLQTMGVLLKHRAKDLPISDDVVSAAAANKKRYGYKCMALLIKHRGESLPITEDVVKAAAANPAEKGYKITRLLTQHRGDSSTNRSRYE
ncbi:putative 4-coumarate:CoA ligase [Aspergillus flavus AF70]|nr:putative 4-coumarate:CoA ligase [Aspergillus flavus AF70]